MNINAVKSSEEIKQSIIKAVGLRDFDTLFQIYSNHLFEGLENDDLVEVFSNENLGLIEFFIDGFGRYFESEKKKQLQNIFEYGFEYNLAEWSMAAIKESIRPSLIKIVEKIDDLKTKILLD